MIRSMSANDSVTSLDPCVRKCVPSGVYLATEPPPVSSLRYSSRQFAEPSCCYLSQT